MSEHPDLTWWRIHWLAGPLVLAGSGSRRFFASFAAAIARVMASWERLAACLLGG